MKTLLCTLLIAVVLRSDAKALFGHTAAERERRLETEQQLARQEQSNGQLIHSSQQLHIVISILSVGAVGALIIGAVVGSKARRDHGNL